MRNRLYSSIKSIFVYLSVLSSSLSVSSVFTTGTFAFASDTPQTKEWTMLVYLNGNNNLDSFGKMNIKQMEQVGSTDQMNVVVQWASLANRKTTRLLVQKSTNSDAVTSPIVQDVGKVDMGDWKSLVEFVRWGVEHYPAKHYFIDVWDHGSGWHFNHFTRGPGGFHPLDISWDDNTGHFITTAQLGQALAESAKIIGHKVDLYASDACLMAMAEVADEVSESVNVFGGSEEVEPGAGWPYNTFLKRWAAKPLSTAAEVGTMLTEEYIKSYQPGGENGEMNATFSIFDLNKMKVLNSAITQLGKHLTTLDNPSRAKVLKAAQDTQNFTYSDYGDLSDFLLILDNTKIDGFEKGTSENLKKAISEFVVSYGATDGMKRALGLSIWLPTSHNSYTNYAERYQKLKFQNHTRWGDALEALLK